MKGCKPGDRKKCYVVSAIVLVIFATLIFFQFYGDFFGLGGVERSFDKDVVAPGERIEVSLNIRLNEDQTYYLLEESIPEGFVVLGDVAKDNKVRLVEIQNAESNVFTYSVEAPSERGVYTFYGEYGMEFINGTRDIAGANEIRVE